MKSADLTRISKFLSLILRHEPDKFGVVLCQLVEGAVHEGDGGTFGAWFVPVSLEYAHLGVLRVQGAGGADGFAEFLADEVGALLDHRLRGGSGPFGAGSTAGATGVMT